MTVLLAHGVKYVTDPDDADKPLFDQRLKAITVECPGPECWACRQAEDLEALRAAGFPQH